MPTVNDVKIFANIKLAFESIIWCCIAADGEKVLPHVLSKEMVLSVGALDRHLHDGPLGESALQLSSFNRFFIFRVFGGGISEVRSGRKLYLYMRACSSMLD